MAISHLLSALDAYVTAGAFFVFLLAAFIRRLTALVDAMAGLILALSKLRRIARRD
jgi:hypothetical protein